MNDFLSRCRCLNVPLLLWQHPYNIYNTLDKYRYKFLGSVPILLTSNVSPPGSQFNVTILASNGGEDTVTYNITNTKTDGEW